MERHFDLFGNVSKVMHDDTILLVNIPNPDYIEYVQKYDSESLQVIDQPIYMDFLISTLKKSKLEIEFCEKYSVWNKNDYIFYVIKKQKEFIKVSLSENRSVLQKIFKKLFHLRLKFFYKY